MIEAGGDRRHYLETFARRGKDAGGRGGAWTAPIRKEAIARFASLGFPTLQQEEWRRTSVAPIARIPFEPQEAYRPDGMTPSMVERFTFEPWECSHLVFVNGHYAPELSRLRTLPDGVRVASLATALEADRGRVEPYLARSADFETRPFAALNTAFMQDGLFMDVAPGRIVEEPIHLLFVSTPRGEPTVSHPRNLIVVGAGSQASIVESYVGLGSGTYFTNAVTEIVVGESALIDHYKLQRESETAFHVATVQARLDRHSTFASHNISLGGALVRNDINAILDAEGVDCTLNGLYIVAGAQHVDNHTVIDHVRPRCDSRELYKGVLDGKSRGVFDGKIIVRPEAQKTDARQTNRNLLLSEDALVDTKPQLEIRADDVKCSHAATIGQLDEDAMFYLRTRAISEEAARNLLVQAFVSEIVHRIRIEPIRAGLECLLFTRLHRGHRAGEGA
jgi:Fe-S cluster assembly protein SufD